MTKKERENNNTSEEDNVQQEAAELTSALNPILGVDSKSIMNSWMDIFSMATKSPSSVMDFNMSLGSKMMGVMTNKTVYEPSKKDKRFKDEAWQSVPTYNYLMQSYLALQESLEEWSQDDSFSKDEKSKAKFLFSMLGDTIAPTNTLLGNPAALKEMVDTKGASLLKGFNHFIDDLKNNNGLPSQVDKSQFEVGVNLAITPGKVIFKNDLLELIQYTPQTEKVYSIPFLIIPPQINKFYVYDLTKEKSFTRYCVNAGFQTLMVSWKNAQKEQSHFALSDYIDALVEALDVIKEVSGKDKINIMGACSGGITASVLTSYLEQQGSDRVNTLALSVCSLSQHDEDSEMSMFADKNQLNEAKNKSKKSGLLKGSELSKIFSWMRPNDLIWNYVVNNYLMGKKPPAFDILYWNSDTTNLPSALHCDYIDLVTSNLIDNPEGFLINDVNIDFKASKCEKFILAGVTDHITPWKACYRTTEILGGEKQFILTSSGHIQSLVNPPGNPKASYFVNESTPQSSDDWMKSAEKKSGTWWDHWSMWLSKNSGNKKNAPKLLGGKNNKPICDAPGEYVHESS